MQEGIAGVGLGYRKVRGKEGVGEIRSEEEVGSGGDGERGTA